jgi:hypothetical protein
MAPPLFAKKNLIEIERDLAVATSDSRGRYHRHGRRVDAPTVAGPKVEVECPYDSPLQYEADEGMGIMEIYNRIRLISRLINAKDKVPVDFQEDIEMLLNDVDMMPPGSGPVFESAKTASGADRGW